MASLEEEMNHLLRPSCSPERGAWLWGAARGVFLPSADGRCGNGFSAEGMEHCGHSLTEARAGGGMDYSKLRFLAWMDWEASVELLWFWGCSVGLLGVQPPLCLCRATLSPGFLQNLRWWRV